MSPRLVAWLAGIGLLVLAFGLQQSVIVKLRVEIARAEAKVAVAEAQVAKVEKARADEKAAAEKVVRETTEAYRVREQQLQGERDAIEAKRLQEREANARRAAADRRAAAGLRNEIDAYARGRDAAEDTLAACRDRAATLGNLLDDGLRVQDELAEGAESHAADLRSMLEFSRTVKRCAPS